MEPILTLQYTPEKRDYVRASRVLARKSPWFLIVGVVILLAMLASVVIMIMPDVGSDGLRRTAPVVLVASLGYALYFLLFIPIQLGRAYRSNEHLRMARILTFFDTHLEMRIGEQRVELPWAILQQVIDGGDYLLMLFKGDQQVFPFIPNRAFDDGHTRQTVIDFFKAKTIPVI